MKPKRALSSVLGIAALFAVVGCTATPAAPSSSRAGAASTPSASTSAAPQSEAARLRYLIEEEKLAHDVYQRFTELWGTPVFGNIRDSEVTHQQLLVPLLQAKGVPDPRTGQAGTFADPELQRLYDQLIAQGSASVTEAYRAGVTIEERDIADLQGDIAATTDPATTTVLQRLLAGSRAHLQAFRAHLG